jgi:hypothetical protein
MTTNKKNDIPTMVREIPAWARKPTKKKQPSALTTMSQHTDVAQARRVNSNNVPVLIAAQKAERAEARRRVNLPTKPQQHGLRPMPGGTQHTGPLVMEPTESQRRATRLQQHLRVDSPYNPLAALAVEPLNGTINNATFLPLDESQLPLALFDSSDYETHSPAEWLSLDRTGSALRYDGREWKWADVELLGYDAGVQRYNVRFAATGEQKSVGRLGLRFSSEDPELFAARQAFVHDARERCKAALRLEHYVRCLDSAAYDRLPQAAVQRVLRKARVDVSSLPGLRLKEVVAEVMGQYTTGVKKGSLFYRLRTNEAFRREYEALRLPALSVPPPPPQFGKVQVPGSFTASRAYVHEHLITGKEVVLKLQQWLVASLWHGSFADQRFVKTVREEFKLPMRLETFDTHQQQHCKAVTDNFLRGWRRTMAERLVDFLQDHYNIFESSQVAYQKSPLKRVLKNFNLLMQTQLREAVEQSAKDWVGFFEAFLAPGEGGSGEEGEEGEDGLLRIEEMEVEEGADGDVWDADDFGDFDEDGGSGSRTSGRASPGLPPAAGAAAAPARPPPFRTSHDTLFHLELIADAATGEVSFQPHVSDFEDMVMSMLDRMVEASSQFDTVDSLILTLQKLEPESLTDMGADSTVYATTDAVLADARERLSSFFERAAAAPEAVAEKFRRVAAEVAVDPRASAESFFAGTEQGSGGGNGGTFTLKAVDARIHKYWAVKDEVQSLAHNLEFLGPFTLHLASSKRAVQEQAAAVVQAHCELLAQRMRESCGHVVAAYEDVMKRISRKPTNEAALKKLTAFLDDVPGEVRRLQQDVARVFEQMALLEKYQYRVAFEDFAMVWSTVEWPQKVKEHVEEALYDLEKDKTHMVSVLEKERLEYQESLAGFASQVEAFAQYGDWDQIEVVVDKAYTLERALQEALDRGKDFNERETVIGYHDLTDYSVLDKLAKDFEPYLSVWSMASDFVTKKAQWLTGPFLELDGPAMEQDVSKWWQQSYKLRKQLERSSPGAAGIAGQLREEVTAFRENLPIVTSLASKALRERHWIALSDGLAEASEKAGVARMELTPDDDLTLMQLTEMNITQHWEFIEGVCMRAEKEFRLEQGLEAMKMEWDDFNFELMPYKNTGAFVCGCGGWRATGWRDQDSCARRGLHGAHAGTHQHPQQHQHSRALTNHTHTHTHTRAQAPTSSKAPTKSPPSWTTKSSRRRLCWARPTSSPSSRCASAGRRGCSTSRSCWRSGSTASALGCTWSPSSGPRTSCGRCPRRGGASTRWTVRGARSCRTRSRTRAC